MPSEVAAASTVVQHARPSAANKRRALFSPSVPLLACRRLLCAATRLGGAAAGRRPEEASNRQDHWWPIPREGARASTAGQCKEGGGRCGLNSQGRHTMYECEFKEAPARPQNVSSRHQHLSDVCPHSTYCDFAGLHACIQGCSTAICQSHQVAVAGDCYSTLFRSIVAPGQVGEAT